MRLKHIPTMEQLSTRVNTQDYDITPDLKRLSAQISWKNPPDARPALASQVEVYLLDELPSHFITKFITAFVDDALHRFIELGMETLNLSETNWMYMLMGSEGRQEQTLHTDQDSALVLGSDVDVEKMLKLGAFVSERLNALGISYCKGNVMASNPTWVMSADAWKKTFRRWVNEPEPMAIMQACIFFDLRSGFGDASLEQELSEYITSLLKGRSGLFFYHMAHNALKHNPPLGFFGGLKRSAKNALDIKKAMLPITDHARIYALKHGISHRNTLKRIEALEEQGLYRGANAKEIKVMYEFLTNIRLWHQLECIKSEKPADNMINPGSLEPNIQKELIQTLQATKDLQQNIALHFRGNF